jgi:hypothetical protein
MDNSHLIVEPEVSRPFPEFMEAVIHDPDTITIKELDLWSKIAYQVSVCDHSTDVYIYLTKLALRHSCLGEKSTIVLHIDYSEHGTSYTSTQFDIIPIKDGPTGFKITDEYEEEYNEALELIRIQNEKFPNPQRTWFLNFIKPCQIVEEWLPFDQFLKTFIEDPGSLLLSLIDDYCILPNFGVHDGSITIAFRYNYQDNKDVSGAELVLIHNGYSSASTLHFEIIQLTSETTYGHFNIPGEYQERYEKALKYLGKGTTPQIRWFLDFIQPQVKACK